MWEERGGYAQRPGERRHTGPHHRHDLVHPGPDQLYRIGARRGGLLPAVILKLTQIYLPPPADSNEVSLIWPLNLPHTHAGMYIHTHRHTYSTHTGSRQTAYHPHQQTLPLSPISYLLLSTRPGIQAVFTDLQTASEMIDKHGQVMEVPLRHFSREVQKKKKRLAHSTGTGTPQEQTILTEDFGSFQGLSVAFLKTPQKNGVWGISAETIDRPGVL